jgi:magnesium chelatase family protein
MGTAVQSIISAGSGGIIVDIECQLFNNLPNIVIVGSASKAVDESRERIRGAFATSHIVLPRKRITVNLAPADIPKAGSCECHPYQVINYRHRLSGPILDRISIVTSRGPA